LDSLKISVNLLFISPPYFVNEINREEILVIKKGEYLKEIEKVFEKALDDGLTKVDIKEIIEIVLGERDYGNKDK